MRKEIDALGELTVPDDAYYGIQTERARQNFNISGQTLEQQTTYIHCIAAIKKAAALANQAIGALPGPIADAICTAADEVIAGRLTGQFPIDLFQGGGGTSINMNVNEVLANRANEILTGEKGYDQVHPNGHVNLCQSTNDVIPSAIKMACYFELIRLIKVVASLRDALQIHSDTFQSIVRLGRTCLQDAVPMTLGQSFSGYVHFVDRQKKNLEQLLNACLDIPLGATAIGTGIGVLPGYLDHVYLFLREITTVPFTRETNFFDGLQNGDFYIQISSGLKALATGLSKMATDFRLLSSGPRAGLGEIELPAVQPGSSIMPGKINPVMPELVTQVSYQICGHDVAISMAAEGGELELNAWEPVISRCLFESFQLLTQSIHLFTEKCVVGIQAHPDKCRQYASSSLALSTVIASLYGYQTGSQAARFAVENNCSIQEAVVQMGLLTEAEAKELLDPMLLTDHNKCGRLVQQAIDEKHAQKIHASGNRE